MRNTLSDLASGATLGAALLMAEAGNIEPAHAEDPAVPKTTQVTIDKVQQVLNAEKKHQNVFERKDGDIPLGTTIYVPMGEKGEMEMVYAPNGKKLTVTIGGKTYDYETKASGPGGLYEVVIKNVRLEKGVIKVKGVSYVKLIVRTLAVGGESEWTPGTFTDNADAFAGGQEIGFVSDTDRGQRNAYLIPINGK